MVTVQVTTVNYPTCLLYTIIKGTSKIPDTAFEQTIHFVTMSTQWGALVSKNLFTILSTFGGVKTFKQQNEDTNPGVLDKSFLKSDTNLFILDRS